MLLRPYSQNNDHVRHYSVRSKLVPGSLVHEIVNARDVKPPERKPFYVQNHKDYLNALERNYKYYGVPFKKPNVEEMPPYKSNFKSVETHIDYLDTVILKLNVLKSGKVRVKLLTQMIELNDKYYSKAKQPSVKTLLSTLKSIGYSKESLDVISEKYKKRKKLIEIKWKKLESIFDTPAMSRTIKKRMKKKEKEKEKEKEQEKEEKDEEHQDEDDEDEIQKSDEPEEDEGLDMENDEEEGDENEEDYVSDDGGD